MTFTKIGLYVRTASYLKPGQLAHAIYRRLVPQSPPHAARDTIRLRERAQLILGLQTNRAFGGVVGVDPCERQSESLNIDWRRPTASRLWRYHLHYFDFLSDPRRSKSWKLLTISDWLDGNPPGTADAWDPYPVSLRIVNWVKFFDRERGAADPDAFRSLYVQTLWLENNLERRVLANHYFKNAKALLFAGFFFAGADAERWWRVGLQIFLSQSREQFLGDGGHYERSPMYHAIGVEDLLDVVNLMQSAPAHVPPRTCETVQRYARSGLDFLDEMLMPDGDIPLFNDAAYGVGPEPSELFAYASNVIGYRRSPRENGLSIRSFAETGYFIVRDGADMLVIDCGVAGPSYQPGHGHADCLSYELALGGRRLVVDSGVYDYETTPERRYARGTAAHNTITVDGRDQSEIWGAFRMAHRARPIAPALTITQDREAHFVGAHDGYSRLARPIVHRRHVRHRGSYWSFQDEIVGSGTHRIDNRIHLAPQWRARAQDRHVFVDDSSGRAFAKISISGNDTIEIDDAPHFPRFGVAQNATVIILSQVGRLPLASSYTIERL